MGFSDFKDVVAFGNNQLWRPLAAKVKDHHSGLPQKMVSLIMSAILEVLYCSLDIAIGPTWPVISVNRFENHAP